MCVKNFSSVFVTLERPRPIGLSSRFDNGIPHDSAAIRRRYLSQYGTLAGAFCVHRTSAPRAADEPKKRRLRCHIDEKRLFPLGQPDTLVWAP